MLIQLAAPSVLAGVVLGCLTASASAAPSSVERNGGYAVHPTRFHFATAQFRVAKLGCSASATTRVRVGLFGHTEQDHEPFPWFAAVTALCRNGKARYYAVFGDLTPVEKKPVHLGDLIRIHVQGDSPVSTIRDLTTGTRLSGGPVPPPGQVTSPTVVIGGTRTGQSAGHVQIGFTHAEVNSKPISNLRHRRKTQTHGHTTVVRAGALNSRGTAFTLRVS
jgi:hypothetical protein